MIGLNEHVYVHSTKLCQLVTHTSKIITIRGRVAYFSTIEFVVK